MVVVKVASFAAGPAISFGQTYGVANMSADSMRRIMIAGARLLLRTDNFEVAGISRHSPCNAR
jgi:hypothetical protein